MTSLNIAVVGGGPAGLMAAEAASLKGASVTVYDQMPSLARKFLMAGKSGLNITHIEAPDRFLTRYPDARMASLVKDFGGAARVRAWMDSLGIAETVGTSGRVFPQAMKASPLLRAWLTRLGDRGVEVRLKHRLTGWDGATGLTFESPDGAVEVTADRVVFACGGGSWRRLGSDGAWADVLGAQDVATEPFAASNAGLMVGWSEIMAGFEGEPVKNVRLTAPDGTTSRGEFVVTKRGLESGGVFPLSQGLAEGGVLTIDLLPDRKVEDIAERLERQSPKQSLANKLRKAVKIVGVKRALFRECALSEDLESAVAVAARLKALPLTIDGTAPIDEAISTTGGVSWPALSGQLELHRAPGVFCAGEMINWDAPTGGYLLTACLAMGWQAGSAAASRQRP